MPASHRNPSPARHTGAHDADRLARRARVLGLLTVIVSASLFLGAGATAWVFSGWWPVLSFGAGLPDWANTALRLAAVIGSLLLLVLAVAQALLHQRVQVQVQAGQQAALAAAAQRRRALYTLLDSLPVAVALCHPHDPRARPNQAMSELLQIDSSRSPDAGLDWLQFLSLDDTAAWLAARDAVLRGGRAQWLRCSLQLNGTERAVLMHVSSLAGEEGGELLVRLTPAEGDSGRAQETLLQLRELLVLAEAEKWHFGQAVHDELGQRLSGMAYFSKALQRKLQQAQRSEADDAGWLTDLANESMTVARGLARGLLPVGTDDPGGLGAALAELCDRAAKTFGIDCTLSVDPAFDAGGAAQASHLYHAIQELVTNAVKHGAARQVQVRLETRADGQRVSVRNNGRSLADAPARPGMGLLGVRSRAAYLGAQFSLVDDAPGAVLATIVLPPAAGLPAAQNGAQP